MQQIKILMNMQQGMASLNKLILQFCHCRHLIDYSSILDKYYLHVLDLYRKSLLHPTPNSKPSLRAGDRGGLEDAVIRSATELHEAGVRFRRSPTRSLKDISFSEHGILHLPVFSVDDTTESIFLNLIAFERCHVGAGHDVTSFICFMDNIIDHSRDVGLLNSKHVLPNLTGSDKAAAEIFNTMSKDLTIDSGSDLAMVHSNVAAYCKQPWNAWRANFKHTYFRNPWALVSVFAAAFLFVLTILQTVYSALQYDQGKSTPSPSAP